MGTSSSQLPTGTVTFLFSDIEGSTRLAEELATSGYRDLIEQHNDLLRGVFAENGGIERGTEGDSFLVVFTDAPSAVRAAVEAQRSLEDAVWPGGAEVRVRMGLHSGRGIPGGDDYIGPDINRAARVATAAHGGQVLISDSTRALSQGSLPDDVAVRYVGEHQFEGLESSEHLYQLVIDGLPDHFPPPRTAFVDPAHLPTRMTTFIGRQKELSQLTALLEDHRLITLVGPGGTGKTSLATELARKTAADFEDGAWFVDLAPLSDPILVESAIAAGLGLREQSQRPVSAVLADHLESRHLLLVLDNFEHLLAASEVIAGLLAGAPRVHALITSRSRLDLYGEQTFPVPPLTVPDPDSITDPGEVTKWEAVSLFVERARTVRPDFSANLENVSTISKICARVDGLPLAIELAASRIRLLTLEELLDRLEQSLPVLTATEGNRPERQQTLRSTIQWSYDLLQPVEQNLFTRLCIFSGGFTLEAAEAVCNPGGELDVDMLDELALIESQSLIRQRPVADTSRFEILETIRAFGREKLTAAGSLDEVASRHLDYFRGIAEQAQPHLMGPGQNQWLERLEVENANLRQALRTAVETASIESGLSLASSIWRFWFERGYLREGRAWLESLLSLDSNSVSSYRAKAFTALGGLAYWLADPEATETAYGAALEIYRQIGDEEAIAAAMYDHAFAAAMLGDKEEVRRRFEASMSAAVNVGSPSLIAKNKISFGLESLMRGDPQTAASLLEEALAVFRDVDDRFHISWAVGSLGQAYMDLGRLDEGRAAFRESLEISAELRNLPVISAGLRALSMQESSMGRHSEAVTLTGAAEALQDATGAQSPLPTFVNADLDVARQVIGEEAVSKALAAGRAMSTSEAVEYATGLLEVL